MEVLTTRLRELNPEQETIRAIHAPGIGLSPGGRDVLGQMSMLLAGLVGLVLLLTCSNVANLFLAGIGLLAGILFGTAPAWTTVSGNLVESLRQGGASGGRGRARWRDAFVVTQLAISLGLVAGAAMLGRSLVHARGSDAGFELDGMIVGFLSLGSTGRYTEETVPGFVERLLAELETRPWAREATVANQSPIAGGHSRATVRPADRPEGEIGFEAEHVVVGPRYFETLGLEIVRGRPLGGLRDEPEQVVVVNEALAALFWPNQDPLGREIRGQGGIWRIVGVARSVQMRSLRSAANPGVYYPMSQMSVGSVVLHVRVDGPAERAIRELREVVAVVDPELPLRAPIDLRAAALDSVRELRVFGVLVTGFAVLALVLAAIGLYGLVAYGVSQRVREMGIRLALGAKPSALVGLVLRRSLMVSLVGVTVGLGLAVLLGKAIRGMLFGVSAGDPVTLLAAASILFATAALAAWIPARRAARVDATVSLRAE
jgi:putative ABC transport system permease protein